MVLFQMKIAMYGYMVLNRQLQTLVLQKIDMKQQRKMVAKAAGR